MSSEITQQIKDKIDIVDLVGSYVKLQKVGANFRARCPFHNEKSASFYVTPDRRIWHCFGCNVGGDIFSFLQQIEGIEFPEALRQLAERAGVKIESYSYENTERKDKKEDLFTIVESATRFFEAQLWKSNAGSHALAYLRGRGLRDETIKNFRLGYAPNSWDALSKFLSSSYDLSDVIAAGVVIPRERDYSSYDRFRSRIMFPLADANGRVVGFSGRIFEVPGVAKESSDAQQAKYVNTPQTLIYDKGSILYGFDKAKIHIRRQRRCLVVEGNVDVVASQQAGALHTIATCGTALTDQHIALLRRYADQIDLCFDGDNAGIAATEKAIQLCLKYGLRVNVLAMNDPDIKDPADYVQKHGDSWREYSLQTKPFLEYIFESSRKTLNLNNSQDKRLMSERLFPYVAVLQNGVEKQTWVARIALAFKLSEDVIRQEIARVVPRDTLDSKNESQQVGHAFEYAESAIESDVPVFSSHFEEALATILIRNPALVGDIEFDDCIFSPLMMQIITTAQTISSSKNNASLALMDALTNPQYELLTAVVNPLYIKSQELWSEYSVDALKKELHAVNQKIRQHNLTDRLHNLEYDIKLAEQDNDKSHLHTLLGEFSSASSKLNSLATGGNERAS